MNAKIRFGLFTSFFIACFAPGCQSIPSSSIQAPPGKMPLMTDIREALAQHKGKTLVLGGEVLSLVYQGRQTEVEFGELPLDSGLHPILGMKPGMRYYVLFPERLDRLLYKKGKIATVTANVIGLKEKEGTRYPLFAHKEVHVWNQVRDTRFPSYGIH